MRILGGILVFAGLFLGLVALVALTDGDGSLACITSLAAMSGGTFLIQEAQRPKVLPILMKAIRRSTQPRP
jgi:hypothetical protein